MYPCSYQHDYRELNWIDFPAYKIPDEWKGKLPVIRICQRCWTWEDPKLHDFLNYLLESTSDKDYNEEADGGSHPA